MKNIRIIPKLEIKAEKFKTKGYMLLSETAHKLHKKGFKFREIPIIFVNRKRGVSNLNPAEILEAFWGIIKIKFSN